MLPFRTRLRPLATAALVLLLAPLATAQRALPGAPTDGDDDPTAIPAPLRGVDVGQRIGNAVPLDAPLLDESGNTVRLRDYLADGEGNPVPVLLNLGYYDCPLLCVPVRTGIADAARQAAAVPGRDYRIVSISIKPEESPDVANLYKTRALKRMNRLDTTDASWAFLTGPESSVRPIADAVGFGYRYLPAQDDYAHGAYITFLSPGEGDETTPGTVTSYLNGVKYPPQQLDLAIGDASAGSLGSPFAGLIAWCYQFSGAHGQYVIVAKRVMALAGLVILVVLVVVLGLLFKWERARHARLRAGGAGGGEADDAGAPAAG
ncbi:SCO family protein [Phycisphaera mikurensis]|uniref:Thioredoxin domain-containing protein n=1 Tax=Phycisphaera mikurensis (strain NBRC 102666 / KCTC 22515 / FYK2301M01) TaxID=1142394 RepID=I0IIL3_PHYMF|nr:SCO family protein [Phycisphaera mikurensis]MBB6442746.1 protein SCO1/2 [Phycisphaera mikurensis]BAM05101.1 hypothetical protein PSMK_29420 [Phycisphaera mikurensis NBRC 102666]